MGVALISGVATWLILRLVGLNETVAVVAGAVLAVLGAGAWVLLGRPGDD